MTTDKGILIQNIFYMLSYAFRILQESNYEDIRTEPFQDAEDLFAAVLSKGVAQQVKHGLYREYRTRAENLSVLRGKLQMSETMQNRVQRTQRLHCEFDELIENNLFNQILKTTLVQLLKCPQVQPKRQLALKRVLVFFGEVDCLKPGSIPWDSLTYRRNNQSYEMLMNVCYVVLQSLLQTTEEGDRTMLGLADDQMARLYERFLLEYYRRHHRYLDEVRAGKVEWNLTDVQDESMVRFLPQMQTDLMLRLGEKTLVIDAKYYGETMQQHFSKYSLHSGNLYQIYTYVKNLDRERDGSVAGVLLYARTQEELQPDCAFELGGNWIAARTLDLNQRFCYLAQQLDQLAFDYFGEHPLT